MVLGRLFPVMPFKLPRVTIAAARAGRGRASAQLLHLPCDCKRGRGPKEHVNTRGERADLGNA